MDAEKGKSPTYEYKASVGTARWGTVMKIDSSPPVRFY